MPHTSQFTASLSYVLNTLKTGLEGFAVTGADCGRLDKASAGHCKVAMLGEATGWGGAHPKHMNTVQLLRHWRFGESWLDLWMRRLNMYKSWASEPQRHLQVMCVLFGDVPACPQCPQVPYGQPTEYASPFVIQIARDPTYAAERLEHRILRASASHF
eukprot:2337512-Pyramimonas_sp.AAC.1